MTSFFITLFNLSLSGSLLVVAVMVLRLLLSKAPKKYTKLLWVLLFVRLIMPISFELPVSLMPITQTVVTEEILYSEIPSIHSGFMPFDDAVNDYFEANLTTPIGASANTMEIIVFVATNVWITGTLLLLLYSVVKYAQLKKRLRYAVRVGAEGKTDIYTSDLIQTPFVLGFLRPKIYLPSTLKEDEIDHIIDHERQHIKSFDCILKPFAFIVTALHWYNPFVWMAFMFFSKDIELACDEAIIGSYTEEGKQQYSRTLLSIAMVKSGIISPLAFGEKMIESRIKNVLHYKSPKFWMGIGATLLVVAFMFFFLPPSNEGTDVPPVGVEDPDNEDPSVGDDPGEEMTEEEKNAELRVTYFDFAVDHRIDFMPFFEKEANLSTNANDYLLWLFEKENLDSITKAEADAEIKAHFNIEGEITHGEPFKPYEFDGNVYTPVPMGIKGPPIALLRELSVKEESGVDHYTVALDVVQYTPNGQYTEPEYGTLPGIREDIREGNYEDFVFAERLQLTFYYKEDGDIVFTSKTEIQVPFSERVDESFGVDQELFDVVNFTREFGGPLHGFIDGPIAVTLTDHYDEGVEEIIDNWYTIDDYGYILQEKVIYRGYMYYRSLVEGNTRLSDFLSEPGSVHIDIGVNEVGLVTIESIRAIDEWSLEYLIRLEDGRLLDLTIVLMEAFEGAIPEPLVSDATLRE